MARSIMIQGTMSDSGKSFIAAALCRIFRRDGYKVAPFKSQNMALNSYVTDDGLEMGRAQAMQAEAAGISPSVYMNPILLKPTTESGSQVIVNGEVRGDMRAVDYFRNKRSLIPEIEYAYNKLASENDIIVIEGAGSPVELNLKKDDIVNMGIAKLTNSPVILVGDIDRGGIFPQLLGTLMLLEEDEKRLVRGLLVNKFRGDKRLFDDGVGILEEKGNVPVVGVMPYININIDDEDSLSSKLYGKKEGKVRIKVIRLPKISNFTDLDVFLQYDDVAVEYVEKPYELEDADMIVIPGTKSTISDMKWMRENGLDRAVISKAESGVPVFGICGGYQILGKRITDSENAEGGGSIDGLGLLDTYTEFTNKKTRLKTSGKFAVKNGFFGVLDGLGFEGYEIHMGRTESGESFSTVKTDGTCDGAYRGNVCGSYVHGIFDRKDIAHAIVSRLFRSKGLEYTGTASDRREYKEKQYDMLADRFIENCDMKLVYDILERGV